MSKEKKIIVVSVLLLALSIVCFSVWKSGKFNFKKERNKSEEIAKPVEMQEKQKLNENEIDTAKWKIYVNKEFGFEMKYPEDWETDFFDGKRIQNRTAEIQTPRTVVATFYKEYEDLYPNGKKKSSYIAIQFTDWFDITKNYYGEKEYFDMEMINIGNGKAITTNDKAIEGTDSPTRYENYLNNCIISSCLITIKPAPKNWGKFNVITAYSEPQDAPIVKKIFENMKFKR